MRFEQPFDDVFASRSHVRILRVLVRLPRGIAASVRALARRAGISHPRAAEVLSDLLGQGLVLVERHARADEYRLSDRHVLSPLLREMFEWEERPREELIELLRREIPRATDGVRGVYLFGSAARRETSPRSDIDIAVIAPGRSPDEVMSALEPIEEQVRLRFGNRLDAVVSGQPLATRLRRPEGRGLWRRIASEGRRLLPAAEA